MKIASAFILGFTLAASAQVAPLEKPSADAPANAGRKALTEYLDAIAAKQTAARRAKVAKITTRAAAEARQKQVRTKILALLGDLPQRIPLNAKITGSTTMDDGVRVDKVMFDSQPNFPVTALLYTPKPSEVSYRTTHKLPAIVMAPGHGPAGKAGETSMAIQFAHAGFIVLFYDPIGQGERLQYLDPKSPVDKPVSLASRPTGEHGEAGLQPTLIGDALARYFLWDGMRAVDYLRSLSNVDSNRIGAFGCSGGGTMTALLTALDTRIAAGGVACYTTSFDALLPSATGPQDSEQSTPNFIASGLDFPDWIELAAPRPYAIIATTNDMFPFDGVKTTEAEARNFYKLFHADEYLALITGPGGHGNLRPITPQILKFFSDNLKPDPEYTAALPPITDPFDEKANPPRKPGDRTSFPPPPPASLTQVTKSGQLSTSDPNVATVFTLNKARAATITTDHPKTLAELQRTIRKVTHAQAKPGAYLPIFHQWEGQVNSRGESLQWGGLDVETARLPVRFTEFEDKKRRPATLQLVPDVSSSISEADAMFGHNYVGLLFTPRPSPPGTEETKSPILGTFYITGLRAQLVGKTLIGMRVDDVIHAVDYLASRPDVDPNNITAETTDPHLGLVLLHAVALDARIKHITVPHLATYREMIDTPLPLDSPQDILPGVLRHYDVPDILQILGSRATVR